MNTRAAEVAVIASGAAYLLALGWAITNTSYDVWGAIVVVPVYGLLGLVIVRRMFRGEFALLAVPMAWGLVLKLVGTLARYWVGFEAYGGAVDAKRYHNVGARLSSAVWSGEASLTTALPHEQGTPFLENLTAFVYLVTGPSRLAGFVTFSFLAYIGVMFMVKAATVAVPGLAAKRYAWLCALFPSVVYWPASIGKEAAITLGLGVAMYGLARFLVEGRVMPWIWLIVIGLGFTGLIRPHIAGVWVAGAFPALVVALLRRSRGAPGTDERRQAPKRLVIGAVLALAVVGLVIISSVTIRFLTPNANADTTRTDPLTLILESTTERTDEGGSIFEPPDISNPATWPFASVRTLFRPLPHEARSAVELLAAFEIAVLLALLLATRRRIYNIPRLVLNTPYVTFAITTIFITGLAYSSFANLGLLTRQKSLIFPLLLLLPCLPERPKRRRSPDSDTARRDEPSALPGAPVATPVANATPAPAEAKALRTAPPARRDLGDLWSKAT